MFSKASIVAALATLGSAHPFLESRQTSSSNLTSYINSQHNISLVGALANIGGTNNSVVGTGPYAGVVVASPSTYNPNYFYTWTRDSALTLLMLTDELIFGTNTVGNNTIQTVIEDYTTANAMQQVLSDPSGTFFPAGQGLGEPKFYTNLTRFDDTWGRPQNDGPALRATTLMEVAYAIMQRNPNATQIIKEIYWPIILNDLKYVGQYWNTTSYELWEEVHGNSFFGTTAQHRALVQGAEWAAMLNETCAPCGQASQILCFLKNSFWNSTGNYILANINANQVNRSQINCDPILAAMHAFDINATCDAASLQPCNSKVLATHKVWVDSFRNLYPINHNATAPNAIMTGRYPEDTYYDGNPWFITTLAAAEVLYDAVAQMNKAGTYNVDNISLPFFKDIYPSAQIATYQGQGLAALTSAMTTYADGFVAQVQNYTVSNGSLSEQVNKTTGEQTSASALTWSFAAFVTMADRRAGRYPPSWGANSSLANTANQTCVWSSYNSTFTYTPAFAAGANQSQPYNNASGCLSNVVFYVLAPTQFGQNVYIAGNNTIFNNSLSDPSTTDLSLLPGNITTNNPVWYSDQWFLAGTVITYTYVLQNSTYNTFAENITRTITAPACGGPVLRTNDTASFPTSS